MLPLTLTTSCGCQDFGLEGQQRSGEKGEPGDAGDKEMKKKFNKVLLNIIEYYFLNKQIWTLKRVNTYPTKDM